MNNKNPLVSIVITSYNCERYIADAIRTACMQNYDNIEIIVSDNCSTDNSQEIIKSFLSDNRIKYSKNNQNIGMMANFLKATKELARGEYITYVSSDDFLINNNFISDAIQIINKYANVEMVHSINLSKFENEGDTQIDYSAIYYKNKYYNKEYVSGIDVIKSFPKCHAVSFGGTIFNRSRLLECNPFQEKIMSGDTQVILQLLLKCSVAFIAKKTYVARRHSGSATFSQIYANAYINNLVYIEKPFKDYLVDENFTKSEAEKWHFDMYVNQCKHILIKLYVENRNEYSVFELYMKNNHPLVHEKTINNMNWFFFILFHRNPKILLPFKKLRKLIASYKYQIRNKLYRCDF
ncbi:glycosyltransferase [Amylibacter sp.]|jgi:glycosyltransferase involved in cell wall biosynthesis|nr:glycosyltransferase [Amylibacter sp.]